MNHPAKVLYITYDGLTDPLGRSQILPYLTGLAESGYQIYILSFEKKEAFSEFKISVEALLKGTNISWFPMKYTKKPPVFSTVFDIFKLIRYVKKLNKAHSFSIVHCRSYIASFGGLALKLKRKTPFIFDMRGFWPDERVEGKLWNLKNPFYLLIYKYFKKKEYQYLLNADTLISLTEKGKKELIKKYNIQALENKTTVIPCCADTNFFSRQNIDENILKSKTEKLQIKPNDFIISYSGSLGTWYMPDEMLDFFGQLLMQYPDAKFLIITPDNPEIIYKKAGEKNIPAEKIRVVKAGRNDMPSLLSLARLSVFFIRPVYSKTASSPTKMGELMSLGIPFITNSGIGDVDQLIKENKAGLLIHDFTTEAYQHAIQKIPELLQLSPESIRAVALEKYSLSRGIETYKSVYEYLVSKAK
ncbi:MAG: glycosyltransferase [Bacteroidales bacterium]|jgi:glycosyltransferase involved in cell wall biosynthesis|nr:glycosyltransferase [Bacteroidales bacterium]MDD4215520.1 glycosyltransferase [Bacteroidales bacterium]